MFSKNTTLRDIYEAEHLSPIKNCLVSGGNFFAEKGQLSLSELQVGNPTWLAEDILYGLERLRSFYEVHKICEDISTDLNGLGLIWLPARMRKHDTYFILLAGGAYGAVCTMIEALPVAARLNELGYDCFCLNYRTATKESFINGLFPKPMDDLAAAITYIDKNRKHFGVTPCDYALVGFSAGGHLASTWGTAHLGARKYRICSPKALILAYPLISMANVPDSPVKRYLCSGMFGVSYTAEDIYDYDASRHIDREYPPCYIVRCKDDATVSSLDGASMKSALGDKCEFLEAEKGGHGFGLGSNTDLNGWLDDAMKWMDELK